MWCLNFRIVLRQAPASSVKLDETRHNKDHKLLINAGKLGKHRSSTRQSHYRPIQSQYRPIQSQCSPKIVQYIPNTGEYSPSNTGQYRSIQSQYSPFTDKFSAKLESQQHQFTACYNNRVYLKQISPTFDVV